jgi:hypothetical protein
MLRMARQTSSGASIQPGSGSRSGRQRKQGRNPAASAAAAYVNGRMFRRSGVPGQPTARQ